jgi:hypothetical protein
MYCIIIASLIEIIPNNHIKKIWKLSAQIIELKENQSIQNFITDFKENCLTTILVTNSIGDMRLN